MSPLRRCFSILPRICCIKRSIRVCVCGDGYGEPENAVRRIVDADMETPESGQGRHVFDGDRPAFSGDDRVVGVRSCRIGLVEGSGCSLRAA